MIAITKPLFVPFQLSHIRFFGAERRRRQTTIDLIHSSPHLLRDIGMSEGNVRGRRP